MKIRPMQPQDSLACARLMAETPLWQRYGVTENSAYQRFEQGLKRKANIMVVEIDRIIVGFVWYTMRGAFDRSGYINLIGVHEGMQGQGIGQALMDHAEAEIFRQVADVFLLVSDFNQPAQRFYRRRGYTKVGVIQEYVIAGVNELIYHKRRPAGNGR